jgi:LuxR family maltose regulon positive regulatory protein
VSTVVVHGGCGNPRGDAIADEDGYHAALRAAVEAADAALAAGGTALDAAQAAVEVLEDAPQFNAGRGSVLTASGLVEMDAGLMSGHDRRAGSVAAVTTPRHAIALARAVMDDTPHVMLAGQGAESLAAAQGVERMAPDWFITDRQRERWWKARGTVGATYWTMGFAYFLQGDRASARQAYTEAISLSQESGDIFTTILATIGLGSIQEVETQLHLAAQTYRHVLQSAGDQPLQIIYEGHLGLGRVLYEWNDLDTAEMYGRQSLHLARQYESGIDRFIVCEVFLARVKLAQGDVAAAAAILAQAHQSARQQNFIHRIPEIAAAQVQVLLRQGNLVAAAHLAQTLSSPISGARVHLAQGNPSTALALLEPLRREVEAKGWEDERLKVIVLQAVVLQALGEHDKAVQLLVEALGLAEPGGYIRIFIDEGMSMAQLLSEAADQGIMPDYTAKLLAVFEAEEQNTQNLSSRQSLIEPLSQRELEVLQLIARGLSNHEISQRLFLALSTVKGHNQKIFDKLHVERRTEAVARARELGLL